MIKLRVCKSAIISASLQPLQQDNKSSCRESSFFTNILISFEKLKSIQQLVKNFSNK